MVCVSLFLVSMVWRQWGLQLLFNLCPPQLPSSDVEDAVGALSLWSSGAGYGKQLHTVNVVPIKTSAPQKYTFNFLISLNILLYSF